MLFLSVCTALSIGPEWRPWRGAFSAGGILGVLLADSLMSSLNLTGAVLLTSVCLILSIYLISTFSMVTAAQMARRTLWLPTDCSTCAGIIGGPERRQLAMERAELRAAERAELRWPKQGSGPEAAAELRRATVPPPLVESATPAEPVNASPRRTKNRKFRFDTRNIFRHLLRRRFRWNRRSRRSSPLRQDVAPSVSRRFPKLPSIRNTGCPPPICSTKSPAAIRTIPSSSKRSPAASSPSSKSSTCTAM